MEKRETSQAINDHAVEWLARLDAAGDDPDIRAHFDAWLNGDSRRQGAFFRAQSAWMMLDRARALRITQQEQPVCDEEPRAWSRRRMIGGAGAAAALVALAAAGLNIRWPRTQHIETSVGEIRRVPLGDGSLAAVNTATKLALRFEPDVRNVALEDGEAWFQVAKDRARPFIVEAGSVRVKAVGTAFSVRLVGEGAIVQVTEGLVEVWSTGDEGNVRQVGAGARTFVNSVSGPESAVAAGSDIENKLAWRDGQLVFDGDTLAQAAEEFNRYNALKIEISDPVLASERMVGRFHANEPDSFANAAGSLLNAAVEKRKDRIILSQK